MSMDDLQKIHSDLRQACAIAAHVNKQVQAHAARLALPEAPPQPLATLLQPPARPLASNPKG